jgi:hypothetical protein
LNLFYDVLQKLESIGARYVIIGGFAATSYGTTRATYDIDIVVDLNEEQIEALAALYPSPRYYADPYQMRNAIKIGSSFNIIDSDQGRKADLFPITVDERYRPALENRVRQTITVPGIDPFNVWIARREDVIVGKLMAWAELTSYRHEIDIFEIMLVHYLALDDSNNPPLDETYIDMNAERLGTHVYEWWLTIKKAAREQSEQN